MSIAELRFSNVLPAELHFSAGLLFDVVVLCGGDSQKFSPLCDDTQKPMLNVCGKPLVWFCLRPWIDGGCRTFFLCVHEPCDSLRSFLEREFQHVKFHYVNVPERVREENDNEGEPSTTCDALVAFRKYRSTACSGDFIRDVLVVSGDTVLASIDVAQFISNFYLSFASVAILLWKHKGAGASREEPTKKRRDDPKALVPSCCVVALEGTSESSKGSTTHHRLNFISSSGDIPSEGFALPVGFLARRQQMMFRSDIENVHVYLLRNWVLDYIVAHPAESLTHDIIPLLTTCQHWMIHRSSGKVKSPAARLRWKREIPPHWALISGTSRDIGVLNSMRQSLPESWDSLRVVATVYSAEEGHHLATRLNSKERILASLQPLTTIFSKEPSPLALLMVDHVFKNKDSHSTAPLESSEVIAGVHGSVVLSQGIVDGNHTIYRSFIGRNVTVGSRARIVNSIVMDSVEVGDHCVIINSVVGNACNLSAKVELDNCFVSAATSVIKGQYSARALHN